MDDQDGLPDDVTGPWQDPALAAAAADLVVGAVRPALGLLAATTDPYRREHRARVLGAAGRRHLDPVAGFAEERADDGDAWLLLGAALTNASWHARGSALMERTGQDRVDGMLGYGQAAREALHRAVALRPADAVPWSVLLSCAKAAPHGREELEEAWRETSARTPDLYEATMERMSMLTRKWYGGRHDAVRFARQCSAGLPAGHPLHALLPYAHLETYVHGQIRGGTAVRLWRGLRFNFDVSVRREVNAAADTFLADASTFAGRPGVREAHQVFAVYYDTVGDPERGRTHLELGGSRAVAWPWGFFGDHHEEHARAREKVGLPA